MLVRHRDLCGNVACVTINEKWTLIKNCIRMLATLVYFGLCMPEAESMYVSQCIVKKYVDPISLQVGT